MIRVADIFSFINSFAPFSSQEQWDNSGMPVGNGEKEIKRVLITLDITNKSVRFAKEKGAELIISHHPLIFHPLRAIDCESPICALIKNNIAAICAHTNLDIACGGVNDALLAALCLEKDETGESENKYLRVGFLKEEISACDFAAYLNKKLGGAVRYVKTDKKIKKIALCGGAGCDFINDALALGADAYVTGDASHHDFLLCSEKDLALFAAGHFETENPVVSALAKKIAAEFPTLEIFEFTESEIDYI